MGHQDGPCTRALFKFPQKLRCWADEENKLLYVTELNDCVRVVDLLKRTVHTFAGNMGTLQSGFVDGAGEASLFNFPYGIDVLDENTVVVSDSDNHSLRMVTITEREESTKNKPESKTTKVTKKLEQDSKNEALEALRNAIKEAAKGIRPYVIDILLGYTTNSPKQTLCTMLNLLHALLYNEKKRYDSIIDIQALLKKPSLKDDMMNLKIESISQQNYANLMKQLGVLKKNDDCKVN